MDVPNITTHYVFRIETDKWDLNHKDILFASREGAHFHIISILKDIYWGHPQETVERIMGKALDSGELIIRKIYVW